MHKGARKDAEAKPGADPWITLPPSPTAPGPRLAGGHTKPLLSRKLTLIGEVP